MLVRKRIITDPPNLAFYVHFIINNNGHTKYPTGSNAFWEDHSSFFWSKLVIFNCLHQLLKIWTCPSIIRPYSGNQTQISTFYSLSHALYKVYTCFQEDLSGLRFFYNNSTGNEYFSQHEMSKIVIQCTSSSE